MNDQDQKNYTRPASGIVTVVIFFILLFIFAKWGPAINFSTVAQSAGQPFIVTGSGKVSAVPDIAKVDFGIQENGPSLKSVQDSVSKKSKTLTDSLKKLGIADVDIKTTSYYLSPQYDYTNPSPRINGYQVSINYEVTVKNFDILNDVFSVATANGANIAGGVNFDLSDSLKKQKTQEARDMAVSEAKDEANGLAKSAGITLGKIINVSENQAQSIRPIAFAADKAVTGIGGGTAPATPPTVQPGTTDVNVSVTLSYEVR
jgi:uncharacterized protein YggE